MLNRIFKKRINEIHVKLENAKVLISDDMANFFGLESSGKWKVRGNGVLMLTEEKLIFGMWKPKKDFIIPVMSICQITNPKSHMHKSVFRPLLKVVFTNEKGDKDSAAWFVQDLNKWNEIFKGLILGNI